ncbi:MAG: hypothetical protein H9872_03035 [Candidatus Cellulosilyticum pullistercoris]|uniref:Uncharacterized protein n=1 Tax=Candidatus Cellulosilyticum pullistercoris TaxID=2838521 RepID=A0A9E2KBG2_9FIRM|nr:hypothetical protein [Candidatus Cellulosilyticum pullistercoris]
MAKHHQSNSRDIKKPSVGHKNKKQKKREKDKAERVLTAGFIWSSLIVAVLFFFMFLIVGMQVGPSLPI